MRYTKQTLENLFYDYVQAFENERVKKQSLKSWLSDISLKSYHLSNKNNNKIVRYTVCHGWRSETNEMTLKQMIVAIKNAIDTDTPLLKAGGIK